MTFFNVMRGLIMVITMTVIIFSVIILIFSGHISDIVSENPEIWITDKKNDGDLYDRVSDMASGNPEILGGDKKIDRDLFHGILIMVCILSIGVQLLGFLGSFKRHYGLMRGYSVLNIIASFGSLTRLLRGTGEIYGFIIQLVWTAICTFFTYKIKSLRTSNGTPNYV